jgi:hypothetical protein
MSYKEVDYMVLIKDCVKDLVTEIVMEVYRNHDKIQKEAMEGLLDDDVDEMELEEESIIENIIRERIK